MAFISGNKGTRNAISGAGGGVGNDKFGYRVISNQNFRFGEYGNKVIYSRMQQQILP